MMEKGMKIVCLSALLVVSIIVLAYSTFALTLSCSLGTTCPYPGVAVAYLQNESGGFDNAHVQNGSAVSLEGLVGWYRFDNMSFAGEHGTRVFDWSGVGNNGTPYLGAVASSGKLNGGYSFDGMNDGINLPNSVSLNITTNMTLTAWIKSNMSLGGNTASIVERGAYGDPRNSLGIRLSGTGRIQFDYEYGSGTNTPNAVGTTALTNDVWHHVAGVWNGTTCIVYADGVLEGTQACPNAPGPFDQAFLIADGTNKGIFFNGSMDDVMIFNRSLSSQEIINLYNRTYYTYNNALCCTADTTLSNSCTVPQATALRISNYTNAHAQIGSYGGTQYPVPLCLSASAGKVQCAFPTDTCADGYTCLGSIASSEQGDLNLTNAHVASCNEYPQKICCRLNTPPAVSNVILNSTLLTNLTSENLTVYFTQTDVDGDFATNITDWRVNGTSIALLNLPFDTEETSIATNIIRDYSTRGNNGTLGGGNSSASPAWISSGRVGGAYNFDGNDHIHFGDVIDMGLDDMTVAVWVKTTSTSTGYMLSKSRASAQDYRYGVALRSTGTAGLFLQGDGGADVSLIGNTIINDNVWHHVAFIFDRDANAQIYVDGDFDVSQSIAHWSGANMNSNNPFRVGSYTAADNTSPSSFFNGSLDGLLIFNRSLSAEQIRELYNAGVNNLSLQKIHSNETLGGENWTCAVTPNDGRDGNTLLSNSLVIRNSAPTVVLTHPADNNVTTNRTPIFNWTGTDPDGNPLTYEINITAVLVNGTSLCSDVRTVSTGVNNYYIPSGDLLCLSDNQMIYKWSVRASDGGEFGPWSSVRTLNISAYVAVSLPVNSVEFGSISVLQSNDTTDDAPLPFTIQNDGTVLLNVNISASGLWSSIASPNEYYRFKIANVSNETGAFNWSGSVTQFTNFSTTGIPSIYGLNYSDSRDSARTDVYVAVPSNEPPAVRNSTVTFMSILGES